MGNSGMIVGGLRTRVDPRTLLLEHYTDPDAIEDAPVVIDPPVIAGDWEMLGNKEFGDCAFAAAGHAEMVWAAPSWPDPAITEEAVIDSYRDALRATENKVKDHGDQRAGTDIGIAELDALTYWQGKGVAGHRIDAFAAVKRYDHSWVRFAINRFGCAIGVLGLPNAVVPKGMKPDTAPSWTDLPEGVDAAVNPDNNHAVLYVGYDEERNYIVVTWGRTKVMSDAFHDNYVGEMYVALSPNWPVPAEVNIDKWTEDVSGVQQIPRPAAGTLARQRPGRGG